MAAKPPTYFFRSLLEAKLKDLRALKSANSLGKPWANLDAAETIRKLKEELDAKGLKSKDDQVRAMKHMAFALCLQNKITACRAEFLKIYEVDPNFDLSPAEAGHPSWTKTFAAAKAHAKKLEHDREVKEAKDKAKGLPPTASVPKKN